MLEDEIEVDIAGEHGTIDPRAVADAITALDKMLRHIPGDRPPRLRLSKLDIGSAVIAVRCDRQRVEIVRDGIRTLSRTQDIPAGWGAESVTALIELQGISKRHGVQGVLLKTQDDHVAIDEGFAERARASIAPPPPSMGSVRGILHRYMNNGRRRTAGLRDYRTGHTIDATFPSSLMAEIRSALDHEVELWGEVRRDRRDRIQSIHVSGIEIIDPSRTRVALDEVTGIFGPGWTNGLDSVEWIRRQRD